MFTRYLFVLSVILFSSCPGNVSYGQVKELELPAAFDRVAYDYESQILCGISSARKEVVIIPGEFFDDNSKTKCTRIKIDVAPSRIVFKKFKGQSWFVVAGKFNTKILLVDAKSASVKKTIPVNGSLLQSLSTSRNEQDPFVYYCCKNKNNKYAGAVNLKTATDCGKILDGVSVCSVSADGKTFYRSDKGSHLFKVTSEFNARKPSLQDISQKPNHNHDSGMDFFSSTQRATCGCIGKGFLVSQFGLSRRDEAKRNTCRFF